MAHVQDIATNMLKEAAGQLCGLLRTWAPGAFVTEGGLPLKKLGSALFGAEVQAVIDIGAGPIARVNVFMWVPRLEGYEGREITYTCRYGVPDRYQPP